MNKNVCCIVLYWISGVSSILGSNEDQIKYQIKFFRAPLKVIVSDQKPFSFTDPKPKTEMKINSDQQPFKWNKNSNWDRTIASPDEDHVICNYGAPLYCTPGLPISNFPLYILQNINQFEYTSDEEKQFYQKFVINATHYKEPFGSVILLIGDQNNIHVDAVLQESWVNYAKQLKALIIHVEHRFWGRSVLPKGEYSDENLVFLNSEQALADFAWFIVNFKSAYRGVSKTAPWFAFGLGHGGTLAARLRLKYPHLIYAGLGSSSPLREIPNYNEFYKNMLDEFGVNASYQIKMAFIDLNDALNDAKKKIKLKGIFRFCTQLNVNDQEKKNTEYLIWSLLVFLGVVIDQGSDERDDFYPVKQDVMSRMVGNSIIRGNKLNRLASSIHLILQFYSDKFGVPSIRTSCLYVDYNQAVNTYKNHTWVGVKHLHLQLSAGIGDRQTFYQNCNEFGQFRTYNAEGHFESIKLGFYTGLCEDVFGHGFELINVALDRTYMFYGGVDIQANHLIFVNGGLDKNSVLSITKSKGQDIVAIYVTDATVCDDAKTDPHDPLLMFNKQQLEIIETLHKWLAERVVGEVSIIGD